MRILGIETSCDDTSAAVVDDGRVLSSVVSSQDRLHAAYGGVVPELAARKHLEAIQAAIACAMQRAGCDYTDLDRIAVTRGPGLVGSLLVGLSAAQGLSLRTGLSVYGVNHVEGHVLSALIESDLERPFLALIVSGGHTVVYRVDEIGGYGEAAATRDDSAGEAFDKGAKMLGLGYPGGRLIDELAHTGNRRAVHFPRARVRGDPYAFSFSGLKTALWDFLHRSDPPPPLEDLCASFQEAIVEVLVDRTRALMDAFDIPRLAVSGGVSANRRLRESCARAAAGEGYEVAFPDRKYCTDNAAMIAHAAALRIRHGLAGDPLQAVSRLPLGPHVHPS